MSINNNGVKAALPPKFVSRMEEMLGKEAEAFFKTFEEKNVRAFRKNTLKCKGDVEKYIDFPIKKLPFNENGYVFENEHIGSTWLHRSGAIYVQEPAAMMPVSAVTVEKNARVLDVCASPGGKSTQLAAMLEDGVLVSNEYVSSRCVTLAQNLERLGVRDVIVTNSDAQTLCDAYREYFDLTVVDAPCSGEGMMRKNPLAVSEWSEENVENCAKRQRYILENAVKTVKKGGKLLYSTCTFSKEENEDNVRFVLENYPDFKLVKPTDAVINVTVGGLDGLEYARRCYPHKLEGEGQFLALFERKDDGNTDESDCKKAPKKKQKGVKKDAEEDVVTAFLSDVLENAPMAKPIHVGGSWYLCPDIPLPEKGVFEHGVRLGSVEKGRVIPHHWFFSAYGTDFRRKLEISPDDPRLCAYLRGEEIDAGDTPDGYGALTVDGIVLGGIKVSNRRAKNLYPKGLRA